MVISGGVFRLDRASEICEISGTDLAANFLPNSELPWRAKFGHKVRGVARHGLGACPSLLNHNHALLAQIAGARVVAGGGPAIGSILGRL